MRFKATHTCPLLCLIICLLLLACRSPQLSPSIEQGGYLTQIILQFLIFLIPTIIYCRLKDSGYTARLNLRPVGPSTLGITVLTILVMITGSWLIRMGQLALVLGDTEISFVSSYPIVLGDVSDAVYISLTFALLPAICEEFVFRSVLLTEYAADGHGAITTSILTALLFSLMHFDLTQLPIYFWCGLILALVTYVTQSAFPAIICHFLYNMYGIFGESYLLTLFKQPQNTVFLLFILAAIFLGVLILLLGEAERIFQVYGDCDRETPRYVILRTTRYPKQSARLLHSLSAWASPILVLCIALFLMLTLASA